MLQLAAGSIAYANERSGLITMIGCIGLVYGFIVDTFYHGESFTALEFFGVALILSINFIVVCFNQKSTKESEEISAYIPIITFI